MMRVELLIVATLTTCSLFVCAGTTNSVRAQDASRLLSQPFTVLEPTLICNRGDSHPGLSLRITNSSSIGIPSGKTIRYTYRLKSDGVDGAGKVQLVNPLLAGQFLEVPVADVKFNALQACTASLITSLIGDKILIKPPYVFAPRR